MEYKRLRVHRLVMITWKYRIDYIFMTVNHKDGNKINNNINNLEWLTLEDNTRHYFKHIRNK